MVKIICEGGDDHSFLKLLLTHIQKDTDVLNNINDFSTYIKPMGGKSNLLDMDKYKTLSKEVLTKKITKVLFIFDCDFLEDDAKCGSMKKSIECIQGLIEKLDWKIDVNYYIFSKNLDYFLIETLDKKENFEACEECFELKKINKNRKILTCIYNKLYPKAPFDFNHPNFNELKEKLTDLFKENN